MLLKLAPPKLRLHKYICTNFKQIADTNPVRICYSAGIVRFTGKVKVTADGLKQILAQKKRKKTTKTFLYTTIESVEL